MDNHYVVMEDSTGKKWNFSYRENSHILAAVRAAKEHPEYKVVRVDSAKVPAS